MAHIGMKYVVAAAVSTETTGSSIVYSAGSVIGKAIAADITWDHNDNPLYADDTIAEDDNGITGGSIELELDDLAATARTTLLGLVAIEVGSGTSATTEYETSADASGYVGIGYIRVRRKNGATTYEANWIHKAQFSEDSESAKTKGENIEWQTPKISGRIMGVQTDSSLKTYYRRQANFDTEASAKAWLNTKAGIS